jgi:putative Mg2+ transporter-C (MgtC) family protein
MDSLNISDVLLRIAGAFTGGFIIGWERETHGRAAGLRTTILACVAAALAMILSQVLFVQSGAMPGVGSWRPDPARLGAGILTGIGFLGGGAILRHGEFIRGVTTAASLWFATVVGLAFGAGEFVLGSVALGVGITTLHGLLPLERRIKVDAYATLKVTARAGVLTFDDLKKRLESSGATIVALKLGFNQEKGYTTFECSLKVHKQDLFDQAQRTISALSSIPGVIKATWN